MRTTAELSKLTGVPKRTLQYWSQERKQNAKGQEIGGAGILPSRVNSQNGYREFSDGALARVLLIMLAKEAGCNQSEIQDLMDFLGSGAGSVVSSHINRMEVERNELDRKIGLAKAIEAAQDVLLNEDAREEADGRLASQDASLVSEVLGLAAMEFLESLLRHAPEVPPEALAAALGDWLSSGYAAVLLELCLGEGAAGLVTDCAQASFETKEPKQEGE